MQLQASQFSPHSTGVFAVSRRIYWAQNIWRTSVFAHTSIVVITISAHFNILNSTADWLWHLWLTSGSSGGGGKSVSPMGKSQEQRSTTKEMRLKRSFMATSWLAEPCPTRRAKDSKFFQLSSCCWVVGKQAYSHLSSMFATVATVLCRPFLFRLQALGASHTWPDSKHINARCTRKGWWMMSNACYFVWVFFSVTRIDISVDPRIKSARTEGAGAWSSGWHS